MNPVADEMRAILEESENYLVHHGMPRRSGRYPWGSGDDPYQHGRDFLGRVEELRKEGFTFTDEHGKKWTGDTAIAKSMGLTTTQFRTELSISNDERRLLDIARARSLKEDGLGATAIGKEMGLPESTVRSLLNPDAELRTKKARETADFIRQKVDELDGKGGIDIGAGVERELKISKEKLNEAVYILQREGYEVKGGRVEQQTNKGNLTTIKAIFPPGVPKDALFKAMDAGEIHTLNEYISRDGGNTFEKKFHYPSSMDSKRVKVLYGDEVGLDGRKGIDKDGIIEIRRGVEDLSLGESRYSQVRILIDDKMFAKGMAVYSDNIPDGYDMIFNTNKKSGAPYLSDDPEIPCVFKKIKKDPDNPFGSAIKDAEQGGQYWYTDKNGEKKLGLINKRADEGDWTEWKDALPSQFLSKQSYQMAQKQLNLAIVDKKAEYDAIRELTNPTIKKHLLNKFADECDSAAVHLQAAALPGQKYHVIIPINSLKNTEVYAPGYESGTKLALIRYPHGGTFEIPILTVNNKNKAGEDIIGSKSIDAIGINKSVADLLSGADFDGDTVMCIPTHDRGGKVKVTSTAKVSRGDIKSLEGLEGFDPKEVYGPESYKGRKIKEMKNTGTEMGKISNLITDMTIKGASDNELAAAVRHSMVVIDAEKHHLDYKRSELDNNISALRKTYQQKVDANGKVKYGGASTLISRSKGEYQVLKRQGSPVVNVPGAKVKGKDVYDPSKPEGSLIWQVADDLDYQITRTNKRTGEVKTIAKQRTQKSTQMAETDDATTLISEYDAPMERLYAEYANSMKSLANQSRVEMMSTGKIAYSSTAKETYRAEVKSLNEKLNVAEKNRPRERQAQLRAHAEVKAKTDANPDMKPDDIKKASQQALSKNRELVGSVSRRDRNIDITDSEWAAIQAGAVSENTLKKILNNTDIAVLRERATPRTVNTASQAQINKIKAMSESNYTLEQIATKMNLSTSTIAKYLKGVN